MLSKTSKRFYLMGSQSNLTRFWDGGEYFANQNRWCFECAWEVANKVGGIYTVIRFEFWIINSVEVCKIDRIFRSKTGVSVNELGDQYILLGPYVEMKAKQEVEEEDFPFHHPLGQAVDRARQKGYRY